MAVAGISVADDAPEGEGEGDSPHGSLLKEDGGGRGAVAVVRGRDLGDGGACDGGGDGDGDRTFCDSRLGLREGLDMLRGGVTLSTATVSGVLPEGRGIQTP